MKKTKKLKKNKKQTQKNRKRTQNRKKRIQKNKKKCGDDYDNVNCCICNKNIKINDGLIPNKCLIENGRLKAHRICHDCWWKSRGFATEGLNHKCPGCEKGLPFTKFKPIENNNEIIDLTSDSD